MTENAEITGTILAFEDKICVCNLNGFLTVECWMCFYFAVADDFLWRVGGVPVKDSGASVKPHCTQR